MYSKVTSVSGVEAVTALIDEFEVQHGPDGLTMIEPDPTFVGNGVKMPERLQRWLVDLRLLRHLPIAYLVPDPALLPPESIRFFHVDLTWVDRVIDGVFSAANTGTVDAVYSYTLLKFVREALDTALIEIAKGPVNRPWIPADGMTGMLIRSEVVRRWPDLIVRAYPTTAATENDRIPVLRHEPISKDLYIALFGGQPNRITISEPFSGLRYGVEPENVTVSREPYKVDRRGFSGEQLTGTIKINWRAATHRVINFEQLLTGIGPLAFGFFEVAAGPGRLGLHLEQRPYEQVFTSSQPEARGSIDQSEAITKLRRGRTLDLAALKLRAETAAALGNP